jgi:proline iminopeptidase
MNEYGLSEVIAFFDAVRLRLGFERVTVMGHSWGGLVAAAWALAHPASVERLIVVDGYTGDRLDGLDPDEIRQESERCLARHANAPWYEEAMRAFQLGDDLDNSGDEELWLAGYRPIWAFYFADPESPRSAPLLRRFRNEMRYNLDMTCAWTQPPHHFDDMSILASLSGVQCPSLVIAGEHDFICGPAWNRPIAAAIPGAHYVEIPDAGHMPQWEQPEAFKSALAEWMAQTSDAAQAL